jgi:hypothetical protein
VEALYEKDVYSVTMERSGHSLGYAIPLLSRLPALGALCSFVFGGAVLSIRCALQVVSLGGTEMKGQTAAI